MAANDLYLKNQERIIELTEQEDKIKKSIAAKAKEINELKGEEKKLAIQELRDMKLKLKLKQDEKKVTSQIGEIHEELSGTMSKEKLLSFDIKKNKEASKKIDETIAKINSGEIKMSKTAYKQLLKRKETMDGILKITIEEAEEAQTTHAIHEKLLGTLGSSVSAMTSLKDQAILFGRALIKNPALALLAALAATVVYTVDMVKNAQNLSQEFGLSATQAMKVNKQVGFIRRKMLGFFGQDTNKIAGGLVDAFGDVNAASGMAVDEIARMGIGLGVSGEDAVKLSRTMIGLVDGVGDAADGMERMELFAGLARANGVGTGAVIKDLAENTETFAEFTQDGGLNMAKAAVQAKKLGVNLATTAKIANSLLDFESSIEKEMEASMMIGKQLNYNKARELALSGDLAGATQDVVRQLGGAGELQKLNVLQRRALAESIGVSVEELSRLASGKLQVESDGVEPIDANTEAILLMTDTLSTLRTVLLSAVGVIGPLFMGLKNILAKIPGMGKYFKVDKAADLVNKTKTGRFSVKGRGGAFKDQSKALSAADEIVKGASMAKNLQILNKLGKVAKPLAAVVDIAEVGTEFANENRTGYDKTKIVSEKAGAWGGAAAGGAGGTALGLMTGPFAPLMAPLLGLAGSIGGYVVGEEAVEQIFNKVGGIVTGDEKDSGTSKLLQEYAELNTKQMAEFQAAVQQGQEGINAYIEANKNQMFGFGDAAELVQVLQEIANNTGRTTQEVANLISE